MQRNFFYFLFIILLLMPLAYSLDVNMQAVIFNESFNYTDSVGNHGWAFAESGSGCISSSPVTDAYGHQGKGGQEDIPNCGNPFTDDWARIRRIIDFDLNKSGTTDRIITFNHLRNGTDSYFWLKFDDEYRTDAGFGLTLYANALNINGGSAECTWVPPLQLDSYNNYTIHLKSTEQKINAYLNGNQICTDINFPDELNLSNLDYTEWMNTAQDFMLFDNLAVGNGTADFGGGTCEFPIIFCDTFSYTTSMKTEKGWIIYNSDNSINSQYAPKNGSVRWNETTVKSIGHEIDRFDSNYSTAKGITTIKTLYAPVFSNEFDISFYDGYQLIDLITYDLNYRKCYDIRFMATNSSSVIVQYEDISGNFQNMGSITFNESHTIKAVAKFSHTNKSYPFNTSYSHNFLELYIDGGAFHTGLDTYFDNNCQNIYSPNMVKSNLSSNITIDNYYMYAGTDKNTDTTPYYAIELYEPEEEEETEIIDSGDLKDSVDNIWGDMGLKTTASKYILSLMFLIVISVFVIAACVKYQYQHPMAAVSIIDFLVMVLLVYLGLLPLWIIVVLVLLSVGVSVLYAKSQMN